MDYTKLKKIGDDFFTDTYKPNYEKVVQNVQNLTCENPQKNEDKILQYLKSAPLAEMVILSYPYDFFTKELLDLKLTNYYSDGVWLWPGLLYYYVEKYHYKVDDEFVEHMKKNNWKIQK